MNSYSALQSRIPISEQRWPSEVLPLVTVRVMLYNHRRFFIECIESILMQRTDFPVHIVIHDDASTDGTSEMVLEYARKYPSVITAIVQKINTYSHPEKSKLRKPLFDVLNTSKYRAVCEGDDYWLDCDKLQLQVDFLEKNEEFSLCCHAFKIYDDENKKFKQILRRRNVWRSGNFAFDNNSMIGWGTQPLTMVYRSSMMDQNLSTKYRYKRDVHMYYHLLKNGRGYFMSREMGVYRHHSGGVHSKIGLAAQRSMRLLIFQELLDINKDVFCATRLFSARISMFKQSIQEKKLNLALDYFIKSILLLMKPKYFFYTCRYYFVYVVFFLYNRNAIRNA